MNIFFDKSLLILLKHEGGYVNHPKDPGGETNLGVTKRVYEEWGGNKNMKDLKEEDVAPIYKQQYWDRCKCDDLPAGIDWSVFDWCVNSGVGRSAKTLQRIIGAKQDGGIGPKTLALLSEHEPEKIIRKMYDERQDFYQSLETFKTFGKGWTKRNKETKEMSLEMMS